MPIISLTQNKVTVVDQLDFDRFSHLRWHIQTSKRKHQPDDFYARRLVTSGPKPVAIMLHREILQAPKGLVVDHLNGDGLDNRRANIRLCTYSQNSQNRHVVFARSGYMGVKSDRKKWRATINRNNKAIYLGMFFSPKDAALAYDKAAVELHGELACTNRGLGLL